MFRSLPVTDPPPHVNVVPSEQLVPLSVLALDLPAPAEGWTGYLNSRGVAIVTDDLGRVAITRDDARRLFVEKREAEARGREMAAEVERQAIEQDRQWRANLPSGMPWYEIPDGVLPVVAMTQAAHDARPRRATPLEEAFSGEGMTFHSLGPDGDES